MILPLIKPSGAEIIQGGQLPYPIPYMTVNPTRRASKQKWRGYIINIQLACFNFCEV
jgi:hypothetical protein